MRLEPTRAVNADISEVTHLIGISCVAGVSNIIVLVADYLKDGFEQPSSISDLTLSSSAIAGRHRWSNRPLRAISIFDPRCMPSVSKYSLGVECPRRDMKMY